MTISLATIKKLPKADLHVHLDGSLRLKTLIELAQEQKIKLPSFSEAGLRETVFKDRYQDLPDYLKGFFYTCEVMQDAQALERVSYEFAWDSFLDGVIHVEPRYSPELLKGSKLKTHEVILAIDQGLNKARKEINAQINHPKLKFTYCHIICCMRMWEGSQSLETVSSAVLTREKHNLPIMAVDLAGPESGFPALDHEDAYVFAHKNFFYKTVHAGEAYGPPSIFQAITNLYADRIGHGFHLFSTNLVHVNDPEKAKRYVDNLVQYIAERRITLEVCLTSNLQTMPELNGDLQNHSFPKMLKAGISVALCTDNRLVSNTTLSNEIKLALDNFSLNPKTLKKVVMYGIKRSFYPGTYLEKKAFIDSCSQYYNQIIENPLAEPV